MKSLLVLILLYVNAVFAQPIYDGTTLQVRPGFLPGQTVTYSLNEKCKVSNFMFPVKAESNFEVSFTILDTTEGYTIGYSVKTINSSNNRFYMESARARILDSLHLIYKIGRQGWVIDLGNYRQEKDRIVNLLDSVIENESMDFNDHFSLVLLKEDLQKPDGLESYLSPIIIFNDIFNKPAFRKQQDFHFSSVMNIFYQPQIPGTMITELKKVDKEAKTFVVGIDFIGNRDSALKYFAPLYQKAFAAYNKKAPGYIPEGMRWDFERQYSIAMSSGYPVKIEAKSIQYYDTRITREIKMEMIETAAAGNK